MSVHGRKAAVAVVAILALTFLIAIDRIDSAYGATGIVGIAFYILGNGVAAATGRPVQPVISNSRNRHRRATDMEDDE